MAMIESIWPSEQLAMALTNPVDAQDVDPADPQVSYLHPSMFPPVHVGVQTFCCICSSARHEYADTRAIMSGQDCPGGQRCVAHCRAQRSFKDALTTVSALNRR